MKKPAPIQWTTVAVIAILAALIMAGHNSIVTWLLATFVLAHVGIDMSSFMKRGS